MKSGYKIISYLLVSLTMLTYIAVPEISYASGADIEIPLTIKEQNGIDVSDHLDHRGVALAKGSVYNCDELVMTDSEGSIIPFRSKPMQFYDDGSVKWMKCSFSTDLKPYELKTVFIRNGNNSYKGKVRCDVDSDRIELSNEQLCLRMGYRGIESIRLNGNELLSGSGLNMYACADDTEYIMNGTDLEVIQTSDLYAKAKVSGKISDTLSGEICVTVSSDSELIDIEYRLNSVNNEIITSTGLVFDYSGSDTGIITDDCLKCGVLDLISPDNSKFRGAVSKRESTGFISDGLTVKIAPIINDTKFQWYDGVTRTNHLYLSLSGESENDYKTLSIPPAVTISPEQFVAAGIISDTDLSEPAKKMISAMHWASDKLDGRFEAGSIPYDIDTDLNLCSSFGTRNGETEFYLSYGYMMCGDPVLYEMITDSAESWADVEIYKGGKDEIYGANRYRTGEQYGGERFFTSHPYYGDLSGLYMAYMISGNEYLERVFKIAVDYMCRNMYVRANSGAYYPRRAVWSGTRVTYTTEAESRYLIQARGLYLAYLLYGDEKYRNAALDIVNWAKKTQTDRGFWYQAYNDDGRPYVQKNQLMPAAKNYIYLYGIRGILEMFEYEQTDDIKDVITGCADFLCYENETYGPGIWHPFGNVAEYEVNEDNTRGRSPMSDIMAVDVLYCAYKISGKEEYFDNMLSLLDAWLCAQNPGGSAAHKIGAEGYPLGIANTIGQNLTLLRHCSEIKALLTEKRDRVAELGYSGVMVAFGDNSRKYSADISVAGYKYPEITINAYESDNGTALMGMNITGSSSGDFKKELEIAIKDSGLWQGARNRVRDPYNVTLLKSVDQYDQIRAVKRPIYLTALTEDFDAEIVEYAPDRIVIDLYNADEAAFRIEDGSFAIKSGEGYSINAAGNPTYRRIAITQGGGIKADSDNAVEFCIGAGSKEKLHSDWMKKRGLREFSEFPSGRELNDASEALLGYGIFPDTVSAITNKQAYGAAIDKLAKEHSSELNSMGITGTEIVVPEIPVNDEEAVHLAANELELSYNGDLLASDLELPDTFLYDTVISWSSSDETVLSNTGILTRNNINNNSATVKLTAHIKKNDFSADKEFEIPLKPKEDMSWRAKVSFSDCKFAIIPQKGDFEMKCTVLTNKDNINALVGLTEGALGVSAMSQLAVIVRFNPDGYIDAYNRTAYTADASMPYSGGKTYSIRISVRQQSQDFDAYVTDDSGKEVQIAKNYGFRLSAPSPGLIDTVYIPAAIEDNCFTMTGNSLAEYQKEPKLNISGTNAVHGISYGKYITGDVYLPPVSDNSKLSWITGRDGMINEYNILSAAGGAGKTMLYSVESETNDIASVTDIAKIIGFANKESEENESISAANAAQLLMGLYYFYK